MKKSDRPQQVRYQLNQAQGTPDHVLETQWSSRWEVFRRLQELDIKCQCSTNEPLLIYLHSPTTVILLWSILKQHNASRQESIKWLDRCWEAE